MLTFPEFLAKNGNSPIVYKNLRKDRVHHNFHYKKGLNVDPIPFRPSGTCETGGLYFCLSADVFWFRDELAFSLGANPVTCGALIGVFELLSDSKIYEDPDGPPTKFKTDKMYLHQVLGVGDFVSLSFENALAAARENSRYLRLVKDEDVKIRVKTLLADGCGEECGDS